MFRFFCLSVALSLIVTLIGCGEFNPPPEKSKIDSSSQDFDLSRDLDLEAAAVEGFCRNGDCKSLSMDFNGDGRNDLCIVEVNANHWKSRCRRSTGVGASTSFSDYVEDTNDLGNYSNWIPLAADVNGDGKEDLCVHELSQSRWRLRCARSLSNGSFSTYPYKTLANGDHSNKVSLYVMNLNNDSRDDFCITKRTSTAWIVRCATAFGGDEWFTSAELKVDDGNYEAWSKPFSIDSDGDQRKDVICSSSQSTNGLHAKCTRILADVSDRKYVIQRFAHQILDPSGDYRNWEPIVVNIDGDNDEDLCVFKRTSESIISRCIEYIPVGRFGNTYRIKVHEYGNYRNWSFHIADVNGDGRDDICLTGENSNGIYLRCLRGGGAPGEFTTLDQIFFAGNGGVNNWYPTIFDSTANTQDELCVVYANSNLRCHKVDDLPKNSLAFCNNIGSGLLPVGSFGAVGGDDKDDSAAIQYALNCAEKKFSSHNHVTVSFPPGTFLLENPVEFNFDHPNRSEQTSFHLMGASRRATVLLGNRRFTRPLVTVSQRNLSAVRASGLGFVTEAVDSYGGLLLHEKSSNHTKLTLEDIRAHGIEGPGDTGPYENFRYAVKVEGYRDTYARNLHLYGAYYINIHKFDTFVGEACLHMRRTKGLTLTSSSCHFSKGGLDIESSENNVIVRDNHSFGVKVLRAIKVKAGGGDVIIENTHSNSVLRNVEVRGAKIALIRDNHYLNEDYKTDKCGVNLNTVQKYSGNILVSNLKQLFVYNNSFTYPKILMECVKPKITQDDGIRLAPNDQRMTIILGPGTERTHIEGNVFDEQGHAVWVQEEASNTVINSNIYMKEIRKGHLYNGLPIFDEGKETYINEPFLKPNF